jgi:hypothetical protein
MVGAELGGYSVPLGKTDQTRLDQCLSAKEKGKLTPKMAEELPLLIEKRDTPFKPSLSEGAKTRVQDKWFGHTFDYTKRFVTMKMRKGNVRESEAIKQSAEFLGYKFASKNENHYENDYIHGTPDWLNRFVFDTKCVWEPKGLDFFTGKLSGLNEWQIKGYCMLTEREHGAIIRILMNPPEDMILTLAKPLWEEAGYSWRESITDEFLEDVKHEYDFERKMPLQDRINILRVDYTDRDEKLIKQQVSLMNEYWKELDEKASMKNKLELEFFSSKMRRN